MHLQLNGSDLVALRAGVPESLAGAEPGVWRRHQTLGWFRREKCSPGGAGVGWGRRRHINLTFARNAARFSKTKRAPGPFRGSVNKQHRDAVVNSNSRVISDLGMMSAEKDDEEHEEANCDL